MNLDFSSLEIVNFKSFSKAKFNFKQHGVGLHFVRGKNEFEPRLGSNGAGKSSIWDAITWCLYGRTISDLRNVDIRPWADTNELTLVSLEIEVDSNSFSVTRTANPNELAINDSISGQDDVEKLVGMNLDVFGHTILLGQGQDLFFDLPPREKMQLFSDVLNLERWNKRSAKAAEFVRDLEDRARTKVGLRVGIETALRKTEEATKELLALITEWESDRQGKLNKAEEELKTLRVSREKAFQNYGKADLIFDGIATETKALGNAIKVAQEEVMNAREKLSNFEASKTADRRDLERLQDEFKKLGKSDICPVCARPLKGTSVAEHKKELKVQIRELQESVDALAPKPLSSKLEKAQKKLDKLQSDWRDFKEREEKADIECRSLRHIVDAQDVKIKVHEATVATFKNQDNPHRAQFQTARKQLKQYELQIEELDNEAKKLERRIARTKLWVKYFKDIQLYIIEDVLSEMEIVANAMLPDIGLEDWTIKYAVERETKSGTTQRGLNVTIQSPANKEMVKWNAWSGGEGQRLRLVGALSLSEVLLNHADVSPGIEILDEPTRHLSGDGTRDLCEFLSARASTLKRQCWLVDHVAIPSSNFTSVVTVVKDKEKISHIQ